MRHPATVMLSALALVVLTTTTPLRAQDKQNDAAMQEMMKKWQEAMTPGAPHKALAAMEGKWNAEVKDWMGGSDAPPTVSKGTAVNTMVLGGRYLKEDFTSEMMNQPFQGTGYTGYDNMNKKYVGSWMDNMSTSMMMMEGTMNEKGDVLTMTGKMDDPGTGQHGKPYKSVMTVVSPEKHMYEMFDLSLPEGKQKVMEIVYTRAN